MSQGKVNIHKTGKGTQKAVFFDIFDRKYSVEEAIDAKKSGPSVWFGDEFGDRGRFSQEQARQLAELFTKFAETGKLA
ncbi:hypothetical protein [Leptospira noguchii]|uniref:hypothetical protein n=1 Tax=Leptospira noguchii TaxID=28182 RepID=UPI000328558C|nr:hypothetical protein [Leptospira noguchii]EMS84050.1 hypothetical protein LEP1GSC073_2738 [Leptospira noguchii str. Cascata]